MRKNRNHFVTEEEILQNEIQKTKLDLEAAYSNFENVVDPDLIDCYIYEVNAVQKRYKFLLKQIKELEEKHMALP